MNTIFQVKLEAYTGPLEKLLELIEAQQLDISRVNLAKVTADYLNYIRSLEQGVSSGVLSDFLVIASRLLLIKSKILIPDLVLTEEEEAEIVDLELRLQVFKEFKALSHYLQEFWLRKEKIYAREFLAGGVLSTSFYPPKNITPSDLYDAAVKLLQVFEEFFRQSQEIKIKAVSLEEKMEELLQRVARAMKVNLEEVGVTKNKSEVIVLFLALLYLLKDRVVKVEQKEVFGDITLEKV